MSDKVPPPLDLSGVSDVAGSESGGGDGGDGHSGNIEASGNVEVVAGSATPKLPDSSSMPPDTPSRLLTPPVFKPKMDTAKAIAILGFSSSRSLMGDDTKVEVKTAKHNRHFLHLFTFNLTRLAIDCTLQSLYFSFSCLMRWQSR
jgi:hypothetical protein